MAGFELTFEIEGDTQIMRGLSRFADDVKDLSPAFREIAKDFKEIESKQFGSAGGRGSGGWTPLSPKYAEWKAKHYLGRPLMVLSGLLRESLQGDNPYTIADIEPLQVTLGTQIPYAIYHQLGGGKLPQRRLIDLTEDDKAHWVKLIQQYLLGKIDEEFGK